MIRSLVFRFGLALLLQIAVIGSIGAQEKVALNGQSG
ncbi:MAG: hypothetical protein RLZZ557_684, partial [Bacteroidota bacterium]